jgi:hypothetical protein
MMCNAASSSFGLKRLILTGETMRTTFLLLIVFLACLFTSFAVSPAHAEDADGAKTAEPSLHTVHFYASAEGKIYHLPEGFPKTWEWEQKPAEEAFRNAKELNLKGIADIIMLECEKAPMKNDGPATPVITCLPVKIYLTWDPAKKMCRYVIGRILCGYGQEGLSKTRRKVEQLLPTCAKTVEIEARDDVLMDKVLSAMHMVKESGPDRIVLAGDFTHGNPPFPSYVRNFRKRDGAEELIPEVALEILVSPKAEFRKVKSILRLCYAIGVRKIRLGEQPDSMVKAILYKNYSFEPDWAKKVNSITAIGGPAGHFYGARFGGKRNLRAYGGGIETERAVLMGLLWLKNHQNPNGIWSTDDFMTNCKNETCTGPGTTAEFDVGNTGLALLAFLGAGHTHKHGRFKRTVKLALKALRDRQLTTGCFGSQAGDGHWIYNHIITTMAVVEAYALSGKSPLLHGMAQKAVDFLVSCQNPNLGWRYGCKPGDNDTDCTGWAALALWSAKSSGLQVPEKSFDGAMNWFQKVSDARTVKSPYSSQGVSKERPKQYKPSESMTAMSLIARILILDSKAKDRSDILEAGNILMQNPPKWDEKAGTIDMYYWHFGALAMFQLGGKYWKAWNAPMKSALIPAQKQSGCQKGSWDPVGAWGKAGGRVYATAINVLTLETYYRYGRVLGK